MGVLPCDAAHRAAAYVLTPDDAATDGLRFVAMGATAAASGPKLGFIGLGHIGSGMCANLVADGHRVTAFDVEPSRIDPHVQAGAQAGRDAEHVAAASDITFLSLPTPEIMAAVSEEWLRGAAPGSLLVDLTTNSPATVRDIGRRLAAAGCHLVEAPLTGGAPGARNRQLVFIIGGANEQVARVAPLLDSLGRANFHLGALGAGNVGKLVNSLMAFTTMWVSLEGLALAASNDIDLRLLLQMVRTSGGANSYLERRVDEIGTRGRPPEFAIELAAKDAGLMLEVGRQSAVPLPVASAVHQMLVYAKAQGLGDHDISDLVEVMERVTGVPLVLRPAEE
jgi:3-hydroxyisobutyrate dehydrogenase-like beta-hydroxyacid dehydrogenase